MNRGKILILTYYWPPSGGPATQRWLDYSGYLCDAGYEVWVMAPDAQKATYPSLDESLLKELNPQVKMIRTPTRELFWIYKKTLGKGKVPSGAFVNDSNPSIFQKLARFIRGNFFIPDPRKGWNIFTIPLAKALIKKEQIDIVITAGPPHSTHLAGLALQQQTQVKWFADFHDAWTDIIFYHQLYKTQWARAKDLKLERTVLQKADGVLVVGEQLLRNLSEKAGMLNHPKFHVLRMGYRNGIFKQTTTYQKQAQKLTLVYTGTMADSYEPEVLFRVMKRLADEGKSITLKVAGLFSQGIQSSIETHQIQHLVQFEGYLSHAQVVELIEKADMLLLVGVKVKQEALIIPGKVYEYLASGKPILNITVPEAETAEIIATANAGKTFERNQDDALYAWLQLWYDGTGENFQPSQPLPYSRKSQAEQMITWMQQLN